MPHEVFVSYSHHNTKVADAVVTALERNGIPCWVAHRDETPGKSWAEEIIKAIGTAKVMVVVFSAKANRSEHMGREVERALNRGIPVIPIRIENVMPEGEMEYYLSKSHWMDAITPPLERHLENIPSKVQALISGEKHIMLDPEPTSIFQRQRVKLLCWSIPLAVFLAFVIFLSIVVSNDHRNLNKEYAQYIALVPEEKGLSFIKSKADVEFPHWLELANKGTDVAQFFVALCFYEGYGGRKDEGKSYIFSKMSAEQGNSAGMNLLGAMYMKGSEGVVAKDHEAAISWYKKAAVKGYLVAMVNLGDIYNSSDPVIGDYAEARKWYAQASELGSLAAMRNLAQMDANGLGIPKPNPSSAASWYMRAASHQDPYSSGYLLGDRIGSLLSISTNASVTEANRLSALGIARTLIPATKTLTLKGYQGLFDNVPLSAALQAAKEDNKFTDVSKLGDEIKSSYVSAFERSDREERQECLLEFALNTEALLSKWFEQKDYVSIVTLWHSGFDDLTIDIQQDGEPDALVEELDSCICSLYKVGNRNEAEKQLDKAIKYCEDFQKQDPWDYYLRQSYMRLCFHAASVKYEFGDRTSIQSLLSKAWAIEFRTFAREDLMQTYNGRLPLEGEIPQGASIEDVEFFKWFATPSKGESRMTSFIIPLNYLGKTYPFKLYVPSGINGYAEVQDQFRWLRERRQLEVPKEIEDKFLRLNEIAVTNKSNGKPADFRKLCVFALAANDPNLSSTSSSNTAASSASMAGATNSLKGENTDKHTHSLQDKAGD